MYIIITTARKKVYDLSQNSSNATVSAAEAAILVT